MENMQPRQKKKVQSWDKKKHWISTTRVCPILGPLSAWLCAKLTFILKSDFILRKRGEGGHGVGGLSQTVFVKRAIASIWLKSCWECWRLQHSACRPVLRISASCIASLRCVFSTDYMFLPQNVRKGMDPDIRGRPPFWLRVDVFGLIFLKDGRVSGDEPWIASARSHSTALNGASPFGMAAIFPC